MYKVLVLVKSLPQADEFQRQLVGGNFSDVSFKYPSCIIKGDQAPLDLLNDVKEMLHNEHIDAVVNIFPGLELVQAALLKDFPHLHGSSFEAAFVCGHRYYSHQCTQGFNCGFGLLHLSDEVGDNMTNLFEELGLPVRISDNFLQGELQAVYLRSLRQFYKDLPKIKKSITKTIELMRPLLKGHLSKHKYSIAHQLNCIVEEDFDPNQEPFSFHYVEGCIVSGDIIPWAISDVTTWPSNPHVVRAVAMPTKLDEAAQFQLWAVFRGVLENLQNLKFDNQFLTIKASIHKGGRVNVLSMYACVLLGSPLLYRHVYQHGDNIRAQIKMATGQMLSGPKALGGRFAMKAFLTTFKKGRASEILNYKVIRETPKGTGSLLGIPPEDAMIEPDELTGYLVGEVNVFGSSEKDTYEQMYQIAEKFMMDTDDCNWDRRS